MKIAVLKKGAVWVSLIGLIGLFNFATISPVKATSLDDLRRQQEQLQKDIDAKNNEASKKQAEADRLGKEVAGIDNNINTIETQISQTEGQINSVRDQVSTVKTDIGKKEIELGVQTGHFNKAVIELYRAGRTPNFEKLLASKDLADALEKTTYLDALQGQINGIVQDIKKTKTELEGKKTSLENKNSELNGFLGQQESQKSALAAQRNVKDKLHEGAEVAAEEAIASAKQSAKQLGSIDDAIRRALSSGGGQSTGPLAGKSIGAGSYVGNMWNSGNVKGSGGGYHLHFEVRNKGGYGGDGNINDFLIIGYYNASNPASNCSIGMDGNNLNFNYGFRKPLNNPWVVTACQGWGGYGDSDYHGGIDLYDTPGAPVLAARDGTVVFQGNYGGWGNMIVIYHGGGLWSLYGHMR